MVFWYILTYIVLKFYCIWHYSGPSGSRFYFCLFFPPHPVLLQCSVLKHIQHIFKKYIYPFFFPSSMKLSKLGISLDMELITKSWIKCNFYLISPDEGEKHYYIQSRNELHLQMMELIQVPMWIYSSVKSLNTSFTSGSCFSKIKNIYCP